MTPFTFNTRRTIYPIAANAAMQTRLVNNPRGVPEAKALAIYRAAP